MIALPSFQSQRYVPPHPPQSGNSNFEEKVLSTLKGLEAKPQILDLHTQSIANLETQIGQLANAISRRDKGKLPNHSIENHRSNYHDQAKAVIILRNEHNSYSYRVDDELYQRNQLQEDYIPTSSSSNEKQTIVL
ncbi:hypothetical protein M9H77_16665 [Catharanthus roseus]|uniref:Uncharacterized protein n=1 Tax=Catharanthus roseus TaxID=4058 RepID=A0ACC0B2D9_CATRO|nr:hypothetical protein M9H77_16665 [Catharanthus roseus]